MKNNFIPSTSGGACGTLPVKNTAGCNKEKVLSEVDMVYFSREPFANDPVIASAAWLTEFAGRLSNTTTTSGAIRWKEIFGEIPDASPDTVTDEFGNKFEKQAQRNLNFFDSDMSDNNYDWHRNAQNLGNIRMWFTIGGSMYGGKNGIDATFFSKFSSVQSGDQIPNKFNSQFSWVEQGILPRNPKP